ncbi:hypothetical protein [Fimbriiglobus ruber]|uniref:Uncharacterized protein n=1 Tax=Fimbriiglobus ruber TaxID=1908690 RepID=A0A225DXZ7_9BACT|nr:hypothetical protein [Fimbriiglobus ruber]OWK45813.1 hypothetical protein FRUB_02144 [Fimbriiglobus ruber]
MAENLWPTDFGTVTVETPSGILREQAHALGARTSNIVTGVMRNESKDAEFGVFRYALYLYAEPLSYRTPILYLEHGIDLYPVKITITVYISSEGFHPSEFQAEDANALKGRLKEIFSHPVIKKIISSIIAQSL